MIFQRKLAFLAFVASANIGNQATAELPTQVVQQLASNAKVVGNLSIAWRRRWSSRLTPAKRRELLDEDRDYYFNTPCRYRLVLGEGRFRAHRNKPAPLGAVNIADSSADSVNWFNGTGELATLKRGATPYLSVRKLAEVAKTSPGMRLFDANFLETIGFAIPKEAQEIGDVPRSKIIELSEMTDASSSAQDTKLAGQDAITIKIARERESDVFHVLPALSMAIVKHTHKNSERKIVFSTDCHDFEQVGSTRLYLPTRVEKKWNKWRTSETFFESPIVTEVFDLSEAEVNTEDSDAAFQIDYSSPGSIVADSRVADQLGLDQKQLTYRVPADPEDLGEAISLAVARGESRRLARRMRWLVLIGANLAVLAAAGVYFYKRRKV